MTALRLVFCSRDHLGTGLYAVMKQLLLCLHDVDEVNGCFQLHHVKKGILFFQFT